MAQPESCEYGALRCKHSVENGGMIRQKCTFCRLAPGNETMMMHYWTPVSILAFRDKKHPQLLQEQREGARQRTQVAREKRLQRDKGKRRVAKRATRAEAQTERNIIAATKNSGRSNRDGDHVAAGQITLDTKLQSTRNNPVVLLSELAKVRDDAARTGNPIGGLVLRNRHGVGVVVFDEQDFARMFLPRLTENQ